MPTTYLDNNGNPIPAAAASPTYLDPNTGEPLPPAHQEALGLLKQTQSITPTVHAVEEETLPDQAKFVLGAVKGAGQAIQRFYSGANLPAAAYPGMQKPQQPTDLSPHGAVETAGSIIGPLATPASSEGAVGLADDLASKIPTRAKAGALFDQVMQAAKDQPVNLTRSQAPLDRIAQLTDAGGPTLGAPNKLLLRSQGIAPIPYQEARDFYSNISNLSAQDKMSMNGPMKKAVADLAAAFKEDIGDTAATVGQGDQYNQAMKQYRQAKQIASAIHSTAKVAGGAALGGSLLYPAVHALIDLLH